MRYCLEKAIPHSVFLGRVVGVTTPMWLESDRAKHVAALLEEGEVCKRCHTAPWQLEEDPYAFDVVEEYCENCAKLARAEEKRRASGPGWTVRLVPKAVAARLRNAPRRNPVAERRAARKRRAARQ